MASTEQYQDRRAAAAGLGVAGGPGISVSAGPLSDPSVLAEALDRLNQRLCLAGLRLLRLRQHLDRLEDRVTVLQASEELDGAITEVRRLALASRVTWEGR